MKLAILDKYLYVVLFFLLITLLRGEELDEPSLPNDEDIPVIEGEGGKMTLPEEDDVLVLNSDNFDYVVSSRDPILIEFYAPWCGHCKSLAPEYSKAAKELKTEGITIAKVDATVESELAGKFGVTGYPTIKLFRKGKPAEEFDGIRTAQGIIDFMREKSDPNYKPPPSAVIDLTDDTFHDEVDSKPLILVEFYAPWCGHCKKLAPEYENAAKDLKQYDIPLAKVDATENKKLAEEFGVSGYPTLKVFRKGRAFEFKGGRDSLAIIAYMKEQQKLPSQEARTLINAKNSIKRTEPTAFGYFSSDQDKLYEEFIAAANDLRGQLVFVHTFEADIANVYKVPKDSIVMLLPEIYTSEYEVSVKVMQEASEASADAIVSWIKESSVPVLGQRTKANMEFLYNKRPLLVIYGEVDFSHQHIGATQHLRSKLLPLAHKYKNKITFALSSEEEFADEVKTVGLEDSGEDVNAALFAEKHKYAMEPDDEYVEEIEEFVQKFEAGKLRPYLKSQPVPKKQSGPVRVLVAKNFEKEVMQSDKDVLIEFYAPWCGHCKQLEPIYKQLAKQMSSQNANVVIAKFDATANDIPVGFDVSGFPSLYFVKSSDKSNPVSFGGDRTLEGLKAFISEQQDGTSGATKDEL